VAALFESRAPVFAPLIDHPAQTDVARIFREISGSDAEYNLTSDGPGARSRGLSQDAEGVRYLAEDHAPILVAYAQDHEEDGTVKVIDYIRLNAANGYREYRNGSLWEILRAVVRHENVDWVKRVLPRLVASALAVTGRAFAGATPAALRALRARVDPASRAIFDRETEERRRSAPQIHFGHVALTLPLPAQRSPGDAWAEYKRELCALAEARSVVLGADVSLLLETALGTPPGYAGFQAPASLRLAESLLICGLPPVDKAIVAARTAAQNIRDLVFCIRTVSCVTALNEWWTRPFPTAVQLAALIDRFASNSASAEFTAVHIVGESLPLRWESNVPPWVSGMSTLRQFADAFQWSLTAFIAVNPDVAGPDAPLAAGTRVRVPNPQCTPMLAAYFASLVMRAPAFSKEDRVRQILRLSVHATADVTALDTVLARLMLVLAPSGPDILDDIESSVRTYLPIDPAFA